ncbi:MAG: fatty acid desaturase [Alphaproteobacteria bacterium]|nr:fatty acid desaturase [Alphaproteobacteria bacterium]
MNKEQFTLSKQEVKTLGAPGYLHSYAVILLNKMMFAGVIALFWQAQSSPLLLIPAIMLWGLQMNHAYLLVHETCHGSFLRNTRQNVFYGHIAAFFALMPFYTRREEHTMHHRVAGSFQEGTNWRAMERFLTIEPLQFKVISACWKLWVPIFATNEQFMLWKMSLDKGAPSSHRKSAQMQICAYLFVVFSAALLTSPLSVLIFLITIFMPTFYLYMLLVEYFNAPHHLDSPIDDIEGNVPFYEQMKYTKSCSPLPYPFNHFYALNFNYHQAHHLYPSLHWTQLDKAHGIMCKFAPAIGEIEPEYKTNIRMHRKPLKEAFWKYYEFLPTFSERRQKLSAKAK